MIDAVWSADNLCIWQITILWSVQPTQVTLLHPKTGKAVAQSPEKNNSDRPKEKKRKSLSPKQKRSISPHMNAHLWTCHRSRSHSRCCHLGADMTQTRRFSTVKSQFHECVYVMREVYSENSMWVAKTQIFTHLSGQWIKGTHRALTPQRSSLNIGHGQLLQPLLPTFSAVNGVDPLDQLWVDKRKFSVLCGNLKFSFFLS